MRSVLSLFREENRRFVLLLIVAFMVGSVITSPVSAEAGYTQGWMGAPTWALAWMNENGEAKMPDFFIRKISMPRG